tara:strand:- start:126 stop:257 length:132 start_codon:yes stop_codon:yes gene_type:complete
MIFGSIESCIAGGKRIWRGSWRARTERVFEYAWSSQKELSSTE